VKIEPGVSCEYFYPWIEYLNAGEEIESGELMMLRRHVAECETCHDMLNETAKEVIGF
jgi:hypothetical protein